MNYWEQAKNDNNNTKKLSKNTKKPANLCEVTVDLKTKIQILERKVSRLAARLGAISENKGDLSGALAHYAKAVDYLDRYDPSPDAVGISQHLGELYELAGDQLRVERLSVFPLRPLSSDELGVLRECRRRLCNSTGAL